MAPKKITSIGAGAFLPNKMGFKTLSMVSVIPNQMARMMEVVGLATENT